MKAMPGRQSVAIIGGSVAGVRCASALARGGFEGSITIYERETEAPYDKPQLSKEFLAGRAALRPLSLPDRVDYRRATVTALTTEGAITTQDGSVDRFDQVVVATGCRAAFPPGLKPSARVGAIRSVDDSRRLRGLLRAGQRLVVIGGGFLGLEAAATARQLGVEVLVIEAGPHLLGRGLRSDLADAVRERHERAGVHIRTDASVTAVHESEAHVTVELTEESIEADSVLVAIGARPDLDFVQLSTDNLRNGVRCDEHLRTAAPNIYAIGDCANFCNPMYGTRMRLEHWTSAGEQANHVAKGLLAGRLSDQGCRILPYAWSDQYDLHIQSVGLTTSLGPVLTGETGLIAVNVDEAGNVLGFAAISEPRAALAARRALNADIHNLDQFMDSVLKNSPART